MMNFGPMSGGFGGISSSSSSNLSPLAPPFTVDRLNPNFNSNPLSHYPDSPYVADPFNLKWKYVLPSAPGPEPVTDSTADSGVHMSDGYRFSAPPPVSSSSVHWSAPRPGTKGSGSAFSYGGGENNTYYSSYVSPLVGEDNSLVPSQGSHYDVVPTSEISHTSEVDYTQSSFDLEYGSRWADSLGVRDGNRAKRAELDGGFLSNKGDAGGSGIHNQLGQGGYNTGIRNKSKEASDFSYQKPEFHAGVGYLENKDFGQNFGFFPSDIKKSNILGPSSIYKDSHPSIPSGEIHNDIPNYRSSYSPFDNDISNYQSSYTPYGKYAGPANTPFTVPSSVMRSTVVIRPPPAINVDLGQSTVSRKPAQGNNGEDVRVDFGDSNSSKQNGFGLESKSCKTNDDNSAMDLINFSKQGGGLVSSTSLKQLSSVLDSAGTLDHNMDTKFVPHLPDLIVSGGTAEACDDNATSDFVDALNLGVDSPCWKGAPYSKISQFDFESGNTKNIEKKFGEYNGFDLEGNQSLYSIMGSDGVPSEKTVQGSMNNQAENGRTNGVFKMDRNLDTLCTSNVQGLFDAKSNLQISTATNIKGVKIGSDVDMLRRESASPNDLSGFDVKECNTNLFIDEKGAGIAPIYTSEGGDVAVHAAEKVLDSPVSEDVSELPKIPDPKLSMQTVTKAMHNLSELLLFYDSNHADFLDGENIETLKHIKTNIESCLSKKVIQTSDKPESDKPEGDSSEKVAEFCNVGLISENHTTTETVNSSTKNNSGNMHEGVETCGASKVNNGEKLLKLSPFIDNVDMIRDDDMAKAIKKVLEENFQADEDLHPQALLYKNLWLEAEAKLCSISYKARFDRMKMQMEDAKFKVPQPQASNAQPEVGVSTIPKSIIQGCGHTGDIEASVMERFNILKSREENPKPINVEEEQGTEIVDGAFMARFNTLKLHEGSSKLISIVEEDDEESKRIDGEHAPSVMARFNILKSREDNSNLVSMGNEQPIEAVDGNTAEGVYAMQYIRGQPENEAFNMARVPHFQYHTGIGLEEGRFGSFGEDFHLPVKDDAAARFFYHSNIRRQGSSGSHDGSSDWEHVRRDDVSWKTHE